jgi:hypothetical protein
MVVSRREVVWLAIIASVLITAILFVRANAGSIAGFIDDHPLWGVVHTT